MKEQIKKWLGNNIIYDADGQMIFSIQDNGHCQMIADIRGWGAIQNLFPEDMNKAGKFQDALGEFIAEAITNHVKFGEPSEKPSPEEWFKQNYSKSYENMVKAAKYYVKPRIDLELVFLIMEQYAKQ
jgi:hypothetical protein